MLKCKSEIVEIDVDTTRVLAFDKKIHHSQFTIRFDHIVYIIFMCFHGYRLRLLIAVVFVRCVTLNLIANFLNFI